jgi:hypothetical protein
MTKQTRVILSALFLSTGYALLIYILSGISFPATLCTILVTAILVFSLLWKKSKQKGANEQIRALLICGFWSGLAATLLYDASRFLLIWLTGIQFWPFDIFTIFGQSVLQTGAKTAPVIITGIAYHLANGVGFGIAYTILFGSRGIWAGLAFAFCLELLMVTVYPGWLGLKALGEFLQVSVFGHIVYGVTLGWLAQYLLSKKNVYGSE